MMGQLFSEPVRAWIYRVSLVVIPILIAYGVIKGEDAAMWIALIGAVLNQGLAVANTTTKPAPEPLTGESGAVGTGTVLFVLALVAIVMGLLQAFDVVNTDLEALGWFVLAIAFNTLGAWEG